MLELVAGVLFAGSAWAAEGAIDVKPYGFIKGDACWSDSRISTGNFAKWVEPEDANRNDSQFDLTANETRLGLKVTGPEVGGAKTRAQVEGDFFGGGAENKANPMMRHAFAEVAWPLLDLSVLGGQTWEVIAPENPRTLNYSVYWWAGNIGYRKPQVRVTKGLEFAGIRFEAAAAAVRNITAGAATWYSASDAGQDAGWPAVQGRVAMTCAWLGDRKATMGVSGHIASEEWDTKKGGAPRYMRSWVGAVDLSMQLCTKKALVLKGEGWTGENLASSLGGIGQAFNAAKWEPVRAKGAWLNLIAGPYSFWTVSLGTSVDDPDECDLSGAADKKRNQSVFGAVFYDITPATTVAVEAADWITEYKDSRKNAEALRVQTSIIHRF